MLAVLRNTTKVGGRNPRIFFNQDAVPMEWMIIGEMKGIF
jgi:hypothetical protein